MDLVKQVLKYLNQEASYAVLRNYKELPDNIVSRDIDIIISENEFKRHLPFLIEIIINLNFQIVTFFKSDRMVTLVCGESESDKANTIQFDFLFRTSCYGVEFMDAQSILKKREFNGRLYHVSKEHEFLDKYLYLKCLNKPYPVKYKSTFEEVEHTKALEKQIQNSTGYNGFDELDRVSSIQFIKKVFLRNMKVNPKVQISLIFSFLLNYLRNFFAVKGIGITFTGPDGAGKTTVLTSIQKKLGTTYPSIEVFHFRPTIIPNIGDTAERIKLTSEVDRNYSVPHRGKKTGKINSTFRLLYYSLDYVIGYFLKIRPLLHKRSIVIFDRYFTDIIADSRRSRIYLNHMILYWFGKLFIPKLDYNILLTSNKDVILERKQELDEEEIKTINNKIDYLSDKESYYLVMNDNSPEEAEKKILKIIFDNQHKKNLKKLNKWVKIN